jgi:hypothetical protein
MELPAHALLEGLDLCERRSRNHCQSHVAMRQVNRHAVKLVRDVRATRTTRRPSRTQHEVIHNELTSPIE